MGRTAGVPLEWVRGGEKAGEAVEQSMWILECFQETENLSTKVSGNTLAPLGT